LLYSAVRVLLLYSTVIIYTWLPDIKCMYIRKYVRIYIYYYIIQCMHPIVVLVSGQNQPPPQKQFPIFVRSLSAKRKLFESTLKNCPGLGVHGTHFDHVQPTQAYYIDYETITSMVGQVCNAMN